MGKWKMVRLGDIGTIVTGSTPPKNEAIFYDSDDIPFFKPNDFSENTIEKLTIPNEYVSEKARKKIRLLPVGSVLVTCIGTIGKVGIATCESTCNQQINAIIPHDKVITSEYLANVVLTRRAYLKQIANAPVVPIINKRNFSEVLIPLPPLDEQKRIAKNLDLASEIVKGYKDQLAELDKLVQSVFHEMFGDPVTNEKGWISQSLLDFGSCKNGMNFGANENGIEIKYLGVGHFKELSIIDGVDNLSTISLMQAPSKEYLLKDEDIIFVRSNGNKNLVGRCVVVYPGDVALTFSGFCIRFRKSSDKLMTIYLLYVLKCASVRRLLLGRGANIQNLNQQILKQLKVPVPPISLQAQFVEIFTEIENQKTQIQQALTEAENLLNSLMQKYFE